MSKGLENFLPFIIPANSDYPWGDIKDDTGVGDGTNVDRVNHADYHQTFRKLLSLASITPNNLPDNVTNGYQYITALNKVVKPFNGVFTTAVSATLNFATHYNKLINVSGAAGDIFINLVASTSLQDGDRFVVFNNGSFNVVIQGGGDSINGNVDLTLTKSGDFVELVLDKANANWLIANLKITPIPVSLPKAVISAYNTGVTNASFTGTTLLFPNEVIDADNQFNVSNGKFKGKITGVYQFTAIANIFSGVDYSALPAGGVEVRIDLYKNGVATGVFCNLVYRGLSAFCNPIISGLINVTNTADEYTFLLTTATTSNITYSGNLSINFVE